MPSTNSSTFLRNTACLAPVELPSATLRPAEAGEAFAFADVPRLCRGLRQGHAEAFRFLHATWNARVLRYCFALARGDDAFAAEVAQATYLRVFRQVPELADETALWNWLTCAMRSAAIDLRRVGGRYRHALARFAEWLRLRPRPEADLSDERHLFSALDRALAELALEERQLIEGRYFERRSLDAIAKQLGTTTRAIEGRLARARARLRELMKSMLKEGLQ